ncbi:nuclear transport factor 2 family protein [Kitasatospora cathayae]|uniref:Nuclear transport factor 2 family protein n=1 Tax=Kitasatospora cathayae TaxID=3004092 RepID=A0ABY7PXK1_9ACTN|nr:nuclear transport factor 2 family protein [Kitasatospora sp. HUAS 3-15]WBP85155.1 nuclear transport factor 2 family protein [Kitasatospora sp. HUAS 3-15]
MSTTREIATGWFAALTSGDFERALNYLADDVEWINYTPVPDWNDAMPWIGTLRGKAAVKDSLGVFAGLVELGKEELIELVVDGEQAMGVLYERSTVRKTGMAFEIEFIQWLTVRDGKIVRWKSFTDPSQILRAIKGAAV